MEREGAPTSPILLVDGDIIRYRCAFAAEKTKYLVIGSHEGFNIRAEVDTKKEADAVEGDVVVWSRKEVRPVEFALQCTKTTLEALVERFSPSDVKVYLSGPGNFRELVARTKPYKGTRAEAKPRHFNAVGEYLIKEWGAESVRGIEADDAIGIGLTSAPGQAISVSIDKDLDQVPGWHYNWVTSELYNVSRRDADFALYTQILAGDTTDNIPGVPGIGEKKAREILEGSKNSEELRERTWATYKDRGLSREYFLEQATLVYILRTENDDWVLNLESAVS
ncbi:MAG: hypothetical protein KGL39_08860 [Patescibacteria group bacterium]|nr:hypothetical protein [Patescibacteria group bacterium]